MPFSLLVILLLFYLAILFGVAYWIDRRKALGKSILQNPYIYALSLSVYCTAWTFYGSVGQAVTSGLTFMTTYIGPILAMPLWWVVTRKILRICQSQRISTLADFVAVRFGKSVVISNLVTVLCVLGVLPYISIQIKATMNSVVVLTGEVVSSPSVLHFWNDSAFFLTVILAVFVILFAFRTVDTTDKHEGMVGAIALEAMVKLLAFLVVGSFVTFGLFDGFSDVFARASEVQRELYEAFPTQSSWSILIMLSFFAVFLLPRQFQVGIAENTDEKHLKTAAWVFPLYLLLINLFVIPIAVGGDTLLGSSVDPDSYVLALPLHGGSEAVALLTLLGGFSASTGMIIVSTTALSAMFSNNLLMPLLLHGKRNQFLQQRKALYLRWLSVAIILLLAYLYYKTVAERFPLVSIGLISFAAVAQFAPVMLGALYWKGLNRTGAIWGMSAGFTLWLFTLIIPTIVEVGLLPSSIMEEGLLGIGLLRPHAFMGLESFEPIAHGTFWSIFANVFFMVGATYLGKQTAKERNLAELYVNIFSHSHTADEKVVWKGKLSYEDLLRVSSGILGYEKMKHYNDLFKSSYRQEPHENGYASPLFVNYMERLLGGVIGGASARLLIASVSREEEVHLEEVMDALRESSEIKTLNRQLAQKSLELQEKTDRLEKANERLKNLDIEKDDFISTVTHELRTPITSIRAFSEILYDSPELETDQQQHFLDTIIKESERMSRLINDVLDLEKLETGKTALKQESIDLITLVKQSIDVLHPLLNDKGINLETAFGIEEWIGNFDSDRMKQAIINLLSNAIKFVPAQSGEIWVRAERTANYFKLIIADNGTGIHPENIDRIFDKFYQVRDQTTKKPVGTGLGLSITKEIIEKHGATLSVESEWGKGSEFIIELKMGD